VDGGTGLCLVIGMGSLLIPDSSDRAGVTWELLPHVSRTFALTIPVLNPPLCDHVAVAYLLCRIADTIEDAEDIPVHTRRELFDMFRELVHRPGEIGLQKRFLSAWCGRVDAFHGELIQKSGEVIETYARLPDHVQAAIAVCLDEMIPGMLVFLETCAQGEGPLRPCRTVGTLEQYCHVVAGTVGLLLTRLFATELPRAWLTPQRFEEGRRFGLGLQITNVLKDADGDRRRGVSYLPDAPDTLIPLALSHLDQGHAYTLSIPSTRPDMRLFCVWACHLALATLARLAHREPGKVPRGDLYVLLERSRAAIGSDAALTERYRTLRESVPG